jgi:hypothetical protein
VIKSRNVFIPWHAFVFSNEYHFHRLTNHCTDCTLLYSAPCFRTFCWLALASLLSCTCFLYRLLRHATAELYVVLFLIWFWNHAYFYETPSMYQYIVWFVIIIFLLPMYIWVIFQAIITCSHRWSKILASWKQLRHDGWQQRQGFLSTGIENLVRG